MMKILLIVISVILTGCLNDPDRQIQAEIACSKQGGVHYRTTELIAKCNDGVSVNFGTIVIPEETD